MDKCSSPKKSPPQLSPPPITSPYSPTNNNNNNSPPDISADVVPTSKDGNSIADSPPKLRREVHTPPRLSPKTTDQDDEVTNERFSSPIPSVSSKKSASPCQFTVGLDVLGRWSDGLMYLGTVLKVDEDLHRCHVVFEDNSEHWVLFKDLQKGRTHTTNNEITCSICEEGSSDAPNEIVICNKCELGYHQLCHRPSIDSRILLTPDEPWYCRQCVFANSTKIGGALKRGPAAKVFQDVKKNLPYQISNLHWDANHKVNAEKYYCYCGGPGDWYLKMLQCCRCKQWFHEACVQCLDVPMMYGDRFYIFVCSVCNNGPEYLKRLRIKWVDLAHLIIYNLTLLHTKKYYDFESEIMPFLTEQWNNLQVSELEGTTRLEKQEHMSTALNSSKMKFACGREIRKKKTLWGLRVRTPPVPPTVVLPAVGQITDEVMNDLQMKGRKVVTFVPVPSTSPVPLMRKNKGKKRNHSELSEMDWKKMDKRARKRLKQATSVQRVMNSYSANQAYKGYRGTDNFANLLNLSPVKKGQSVLDSIKPLETTFRCGGRGMCTHKLQEDNRQTFVSVHANSQIELRVNTSNREDRPCTSRIPDNYSQSVTKTLDNCSVCCTSPLCTVHSSHRRRLHKKKRRRKTKHEPESSQNSPMKSRQSISPKISPIKTSFISISPSPSKSSSRSTSKSVSKSPTTSPVKSPLKFHVKSPVKTPTKSKSPMKLSKQSPLRSPPRRDLCIGGDLSLGKLCVNGVNRKTLSLDELKRSVSSYFGAEGRLACGEKYQVLGKRVTADGKVQYLIQWDGVTP